MFGARYLQTSKLGKPQLAFNFDGGAAHVLRIGATGGYRMTIDIDGIASHAGNHPEEGVSAIAIASLAIADLVQRGWHGLVAKDGSTGTSNVGIIHGGEATNVVTDHVQLRAEARSHEPKFRQRIVKEIENAFKRAAGAVRNMEGKTRSRAIRRWPRLRIVSPAQRRSVRRRRDRGNRGRTTHTANSPSPTAAWTPTGSPRTASRPSPSAAASGISTPPASNLISPNSTVPDESHFG